MLRILEGPDSEELMASIAQHKRVMFIVNDRNKKRKLWCDVQRLESTGVGKSLLGIKVWVCYGKKPKPGEQHLDELVGMYNPQNSKHEDYEYFVSE